VDQVLDQKILPLNIPAYTGAMFGHDLVSQFVLPIGVMVELDADAGTSQYMRRACRAAMLT